MEYFADRNLGRFDFPDYLRGHGLTVHAHDDHFSQLAADEAWIPEVAARGWIILSPDLRVMRNPVELAAIMRSGASFLCLGGW